MNDNFSEVGFITDNGFVINGLSGNEIVNLSVSEIEDSYKKRFSKY